MDSTPLSTTPTAMDSLVPDGWCLTDGGNQPFDYNVVPETGTFTYQVNTTESQVLRTPQKSSEMLRLNLLSTSLLVALKPR